jgi:hypothetical protein
MHPGHDVWRSLLMEHCLAYWHFPCANNTLWLSNEAEGDSFWSQFGRPTHSIAQREISYKAKHTLLLVPFTLKKKKSHAVPPGHGVWRSLLMEHCTGYWHFPCAGFEVQGSSGSPSWLSFAGPRTQEDSDHSLPAPTTHLAEHVKPSFSLLATDTNPCRPSIKQHTPLHSTGTSPERETPRTVVRNTKNSCAIAHWLPVSVVRPRMSVFASKGGCARTRRKL